MSANDPQPLNNIDGADISGIFDPAWEAVGIPRVLLLAGVLAESGLNPRAERWGRYTSAARSAIQFGDVDWLQMLINGAWPDISFGYSQRIVLYHELGDQSATVGNCLDVRERVFADPAGDLLAMAQRLSVCLAASRQGDLSPVGGDELLGALCVYNAGHLAPPGDPWWSSWAGNVASYKAMLDRLRAG